jgi:RimJ/RimL family protein N-acetyltransferase
VNVSGTFTSKGASVLYMTARHGTAALLNPLCLLLSPLALVWILVYSVSKRFTWWPHLWLGISLAIAAIPTGLPAVVTPILSRGTRLLADVFEEARALGAEEIEHVMDDPPMRPQFQHHPEQRTELLESVGFAFRRETGRFEWRGGEPPAIPGRLSFRTLEEIGEDSFVEAMRMVSEGTLDREIQGERERLGAERAAREFFEDARRVEHDPAWWRLAYTPEGELVGLVMPAEPPGFLTIFYVGVVPGMRGQGYVDDLLAAGTATLLEARRREGNEKPLRADTDVANGPMAAAFERAGWSRFARRREYVICGMQEG